MCATSLLWPQAADGSLVAHVHGVWSTGRIFTRCAFSTQPSRHSETLYMKIEFWTQKDI